MRIKTRKATHDPAVLDALERLANAWLAYQLAEVGSDEEAAAKAELTVAHDEAKAITPRTAFAMLVMSTLVLDVRHDPDDLELWRNTTDREGLEVLLEVAAA